VFSYRITWLVRFCGTNNQLGRFLVSVWIRVNFQAILKYLAIIQGIIIILNGVLKFASRVGDILLSGLRIWEIRMRFIGKVVNQIFAVAFSTSHASEIFICNFS